MADDQPFDGMPEPTTPTRITFIGVRVDSRAADVFTYGARHEFKVSGEVVHLGPKKKADGSTYLLVQVEVDNVVPLTYAEPLSGAPDDQDDDESELV